MLCVACARVCHRSANHAAIPADVRSVPGLAFNKGMASMLLAASDAEHAVAVGKIAVDLGRPRVFSSLEPYAADAADSDSRVTLKKGTGICPQCSHATLSAATIIEQDYESSTSADSDDLDKGDEYRATDAADSFTESLRWRAGTRVSIHGLDVYAHLVGRIVRGGQMSDCCDVVFDDENCSQSFKTKYLRQVYSNTGDDHRRAATAPTGATSASPTATPTALQVA